MARTFTHRPSRGKAGFGSLWLRERVDRRGTLGGLGLRAENIETLDAQRADSLDFYARLCSVVQQRRDAELRRNGDAVETLDDPRASPRMPVTLTHPVSASPPLPMISRPQQAIRTAS